MKSFLDYLTWPTALLGGLILISRYFLACATQSMRQATPKIDPRVWELSSLNEPSSQDSSA